MTAQSLKPSAKDIWDYEPNATAKDQHVLTGKVTVDSSANGYRLPTANEWVYAASGGYKTDYAGSNTIDEVGWYSRNSSGQTQPVAKNAVGENGQASVFGFRVVKAKSAE